MSSVYVVSSVHTGLYTWTTIIYRWLFHISIPSQGHVAILNYNGFVSPWRLVCWATTTMSYICMCFMLLTLNNHLSLRVGVIAIRPQPPVKHSRWNRTRVLWYTFGDSKKTATRIFFLIAVPLRIIVARHHQLLTWCSPPSYFWLFFLFFFNAQIISRPPTTQCTSLINKV